ncbi:MAG: hypothetical protein JWM22_610 [Frankiales bacterium]|nr:hypothetical protein [Frankiales bacterium]
MPSSPLGTLLDSSTPEPSRGIDVTALLRRSRARQRARAVLATVVVIGLASVAVAGVQGFGTNRSDPAPPAATKLPQPTVTVSPNFASAPDVRGMDVDAATAALGRGECMSSERVVQDAAPIGEVVTQQQTAGDVCEVTLTVSAGPAQSAVPCTHLAVDAGELGAAAGTSFLVFVFRNAGAVPCRLQGYPDVSATESHTGRTIVARHLSDSFLGISGKSAASYLLRPGEHVSATVEGGNNPAGTATSCTVLHPFQAGANGSSSTVDRTVSNCAGLAVTNFVPGASGMIR